VDDVHACEAMKTSPNGGHQLIFERRSSAWSTRLHGPSGIAAYAPLAASTEIALHVHTVRTTP
jgi:hypothetical protein